MGSLYFKGNRYGGSSGGGGLIGSVIKNIQRGVVEGNLDEIATVTLEGFTNLDNMVVLINESYPVYINNLTLESLEVGCTGDCIFSYQVIEFS